MSSVSFLKRFSICDIMYQRMRFYLLNWEENVVYIRKNKTWNDKTKEPQRKLLSFTFPDFSSGGGSGRKKSVLYGEELGKRHFILLYNLCCFER